MTATDFNTVLPEVVLASFAMLALLFGVSTGKDKVAPLLVWTTAGLFVALALVIGFSQDGPAQAFGGMFQDDAFARFSKVMILLSSASVLVMSRTYMERRGLLRFEYPVLVALSVVGMMVMVSAGDLMSLYMGLELQSLALYVIAALRRDSVKSTEAGLKYFVLGALSSGLLLYGASLTYGYAGTTLFSGITTTLDQGLPLGLLFGLVFMIAGLAFKVSAVPFHMWSPDVYEGAPTPVTAFFATAPKVAAVALLARLMHDAFGAITDQWAQVLAVLAVGSMFLGAVAAIGQRDVKRLMAYSSIAHMGFALMGLAAGNAQGVEAMLIYMAIYVTMNVGTFALILSLEKDGVPITTIDAMNGLAKRDPWRSFGLLVLMFSLAGVPPMVGFFGKLAVLRAAFDAGLGWLAISGVIASVIGAFYYLRIVYFVYFGKDSDGTICRMDPIQSLLFTGAWVAMLVGVLNLFGIEDLATTAARALVN
ncbi:MAG: NADH-quinone oxidoreductase subunit NuoN [Paracoccaceae bacterium]|nr:NADH-quinone oxidoreductase subunit NuoN [Paracoccaceae bacterium]